MTTRKIARALLSVSDKSGLVEFAKALSEQREKQFLRRTLDRYFSPPVVRKIIEQPEILFYFFRTRVLQ